MERKKYKLDYTRYADDLTFSTNNRIFLNVIDCFFKELTHEIDKFGFAINREKTNVNFRDSKQMVTGLIVNRKVNVDKTYFKKTKAMAHRLYTKGEFEIDGLPGTINQLEGRFSFIDQLDYYNNKLDDAKHTFRTLYGREKEYRKFLFYKYFFANEKPLVVTEGKTDVVYLRAALKNMYQQYQNLIDVNEDGKFDFKISFLRRSKRLEYFLNIGLDGANVMNNIYKYFAPNPVKDSKHYPAFLNYFLEVSPTPPRNPVIFLFDNELSNEKKPISCFVKHINLEDSKKQELQNKQTVKLIDNGNLFLMTSPLVAGKNECEIEDLFDDNTRNHMIDGKSFSRKDEYDKDKHYGKEIFSKYIVNNYKKIDFAGFKGILDSINMIVESYD